MEGKPATATHTPVAQHTLHHFSQPPITFSSQFDSGNLGRVELTAPDSFSLWTVPDCYGSQAESSCRSWFHFSVQLQPPKRLILTIKNLNLQGKLYREGMKPVVRTSTESWQRLPCPVTYTVAGEVATLFEVTFTYEFTQNQTWFAFSYPWSYTDNDLYINSVAGKAKEKGLFTHQTTLVMSLEGRKCDLLAISSHSGLSYTPNQDYPRPLYPSGNALPCFSPLKPTIFLSARVHPGETPSSYLLKGLLDWLVSEDPRAQTALDKFIFIAVPLLNPDGVYRGYYRLDTRGVNLNRSYTAPEIACHPTIWAVKEVITRLNTLGNLYAYIDLHAHASKRGIFVYGNHMDFWRDVTARAFAKTLSLNCPHFDYEGSIFDEEHMKTVDNSGSKEGAGRVALYLSTGVPLCFTLETNFNSGANLGTLHSSGLSLDTEEEKDARFNRLYDIQIFTRAGKAVGISLLDSIDSNPHSRLSLNGYPTFIDLKSNIADGLATLPGYRADESVRKQLKSKYDFLTSKSRPVIPKVRFPRIRFRPLLNRSQSKTPSNDRPAVQLTRPNRRLSSEVPLLSRRSAMVTPCRKQQNNRKPSCESQNLIFAVS